MTDILGGGLVFGVAAVLWVVYLIPSWMRRRNFVATESNAVRMQQTIRALVETQDSPTAVDAELSARGLHAQRKKLHEAEVAAAAKLRAARRASHEPREKAELSPAQVYAIAKHRRRTFRVIGFILFLAALLATAAGVALFIYTGTPTLIFIGSGALVASLVTLRVLAARGRRAMAQASRAPRVAAPARATQTVSVPVSRTDPRAWTPQQLPDALHLKPGSLASNTVAASDMAARLRQAALEEAYRARTDQSRPIEFAPVQAAQAAQGAQAAQAAQAPQTSQETGQTSESQTWNLDDIYRRRAAG